MAYKKIRVQEAFRTSLEAQWLRLHTHNAGGRGSIPDWERLRMLHHQKKGGGEKHQGDAWRSINQGESLIL